MAEIKQNIVNLVREEGISLRKISDILGRDYDEILKIGKELKASGELTDKDFEEGRNRRKLKFLQENEQIQRILSYKRDGISDNKISKMPDITMVQSDINKYVKECIDFGLITSGEIKNAVDKRKERDKEEKAKTIQNEIENAKDSDPKEILPIEKDKVLRCLILGYDIYDVKARFGNVDSDMYYRFTKELIAENRITKGEIEEYRAKKVENDKKTVLQCLKEGMSQSKTADRIKGTKSLVRKYIDEIKVEYNISDEDILSWKEEKEDSVVNKKKAVLEGLIDGLTKSETVERYPNQNLTVEQVGAYRRVLVDEGKITDDQILEYRRARREDKTDKNELTRSEEEVYRYLIDGVKVKEIAKAVTKEVSSIYSIISRIKNKGKITDDEIKKAREERERKEEEKAKEKERLEREEAEREKEERLREERARIENVKKEREEAKEEKEREERLRAQRAKAERVRLEREKAKKEEIRRRELGKKDTKSEDDIEEARKKREKDRRNLQIMQSKIKNDVNLNISLTEEKIDRIKEYINASYEFYDKERMPVAELAFIEKAIRKMPISEEEFIRFSRACVKSQDSFRAFCMLQKRNELDIKIESEENLKHLEQYLKNACKIERAIQMIKTGNTETEAIIDATKLSADRVNILKIRLSNRPLNFLNFETREKVIKAYMDHKGLSAFYERRGTTDFERADIENQVAYRKISPTKRDEIQEIRQDSKVRIVALCTKLGLKKEITAGVIKESTSEEVEEYLEKALKGGLIKEDELQGIKMLEDPFKEDKERSK